MQKPKVTRSQSLDDSVSKKQPMITLEYSIPLSIISPDFERAIEQLEMHLEQNFGFKKVKVNQAKDGMKRLKFTRLSYRDDEDDLAFREDLRTWAAWLPMERNLVPPYSFELRWTNGDQQGQVSFITKYVADMMTGVWDGKFKEEYCEKTSYGTIAVKKTWSLPLPSKNDKKVKQTKGLVNSDD